MGWRRLFLSEMAITQIEKPHNNFKMFLLDIGIYHFCHMRNIPPEVFLVIPFLFCYNVFGCLCSDTDMEGA